MRFPFRFAVILGLVVLATPVHAFPISLGIGERGKLDRLNRTLCGHVLDYTNNHGRDSRIHSQALCQCRGVYVYLPPGYDGTTPFPAMLWLHGLGGTEKDFLNTVPHFDELIRSGCMPPVVIVAADASARNGTSLRTNGSFYLNSPGGRFEDYMIDDVWGWALRSFAIRPEREAHVIAGESMGGFGAYSLGLKHKDQFANIAGMIPALDLLYIDCRGDRFADYDPNCIGRRTVFRRYDIMARYGGIYPVFQKRMLDPLFGKSGTVDLELFRLNNPVDLLELRDVRPGDHEMFIAYSTKDEFNIDAQAEHFIDVACKRGIHPTVLKMEGSHHTIRAATKSFPAFGKWMTPLLAAYVQAKACSGVAPIIAIRPQYLCPLPASPGTLALR